MKNAEGNPVLSPAELAAGRFTSLDEYFAHMGDLLTLNKPIYMLLPLDEAPFVINANARTISIPADFAKCGAVKGDTYCEIATFVIDRYFDFKDLSEAQIAVQWVNANKEEGISHIQLIDLESEEGKIRFGWPLVSDITKYPGQVQFAVRFFIEDDVTAGKYHYLLNTQTFTLNVKDSLNVVAPKHEYENDINEFKRFVSNSSNPAFTTPKSPFFTTVNGGIDLPKYGAINLEDNTLTLEAQAVAADLGDITYKWFYIPSGSETKRELVDGAVYELESLKHVLVDPIPETKGLDKYWVNTGSEEAASYSLYTGEWPPEEGTKLYEVITSLKMVDSTTDIVGEYWVEAVNTITGTAAIANTTNPVASTHCIVPAPNKMVYVKDLKDHQFALAENGKAAQATLAIELKADGNEPHLTYTWYKSVNGVDGTYAKIDGADGPSYVATQAGWYKVEPKAELNRKVESEVSTKCKVTMVPAAPVITKLSYKLKDATDYTELGEDDTMLPVYKFGDLITLRVETDLDNAPALGLLSEELHYTWYVRESDTELARELKPADCGVNGLLEVDTVLDSNEITVRCVKDGAAYSYFCVITNHIQDKNRDKTTNSSEYNVFIIK